VIKHRRCRDDLGLHLKLPQGPAGLRIPERAENGHPLLPRQLTGPLGRVHPEHAQSMLGEGTQERAVVAPDIDGKIVGLEAQLGDELRHQPLEVADHGCVHPRDVGMVLE
jgi:hypothetical protein